MKKVNSVEMYNEEVYDYDAEKEQKDIEDLEQSLNDAKNIFEYLNTLGERQYVYGNDLIEGKQKSIGVGDFFLYRLKEITFEEKSPERETMENIFTVFRDVPGVNLLYLILGDTGGARFYLGVAKDLLENAELDISEVASDILLPAIKGNFRGCVYEEATNEDKLKILELIQCKKKGSDKKKIETNESGFSGMLEGIPTINERNSDEERFQGVERLADIMLSDLEKKDAFAVMVVIKPIKKQTIAKIEQQVYQVCDMLTPMTEETLQYSQNHSSNRNDDIRTENSESGSDNTSHSESVRHSSSSSDTNDKRKEESSSIQVTEGNGVSYGYSKNDSVEKNRESDAPSSESSNANHSLSYQGNDQYNNSYAENESNSKSTSVDDSYDDSTSHNIEVGYAKNNIHSKGNTWTGNFSRTQQVRKGNKCIGNWLKYVDDVLLPRLDKGSGKGLFHVCTYLWGSDKTIYLRLARTMTSLFSGEVGNRVPLVVSDLFNNQGNGAGKDVCLYNLQNMQIPQISPKKNECSALATFFSSYLTADKVDDNKDAKKFCGNWMTADELSVIAGMPQKEVIGLRLRQEVNFGLNIDNVDGEKNVIRLGNIVKNGEPQKNISVSILKENLDKHTFVAGVTGSGKTNTCRKILSESGLPFMIIEPAKTEYRVLNEEDVLYFTLGDNKGAPFFLNPFELFPGETVTSRADMLKATFEATFHMEAAIPQLLEAAIYRVYEEKGWSIGNNTWRGKDEMDEDGPFSKDVDAFPTLQDYFDIIPTIIKEQGFDERLHDEYLGTIRALLQGLMVGAKGMMFNTQHSVDFRDLITRKVVFELEEIKNGSEKSMVMGFIMTNLMQAVKAKYYESEGQKKRFQHITLVEEAHRLLSRYQPGDSNNKKQGVEVFADMLAEVRKYGESLIIVDQIPDKMTPEVLKNTNTKIVHKIFAQDDKDTIGNTMALSDEQKDFLSNLATGRAIVFTQGWTKAVQVQIDEFKAADKELDRETIRNRAMRYYVLKIGSGLFPGISMEQSKKMKEDDKILLIEKYLRLRSDDGFRAFVEKIYSLGNRDDVNILVNGIRTYMKKYGENAFKAVFAYLKIRKGNEYIWDEVKQKKLDALVGEVTEGKIDFDSFRTNYNLIF
ncbi:MAG: hypothetical protein MJ048_00575 [Acidaminococcaceae bacterium]|nr:hypothetical protein [Acidaminococcaceae bacterium]